MATTIAEVQFMTREAALAELGLKERRLRDYITAGRIRKNEDRLLHAGDVATLKEELNGKKATAQLRAQATMPAGPEHADAAERQSQSGKAAGPAKGQIGDEATEPLPEARPFDSMPPCVRLSVKEAAAYMRMGESRLRRLIAGRDFPGSKDGHTLLRRRDLDEL